MRLLFAAICSLLCASSGQAQGNEMDTVSVRPIQLTESVYMLTGEGGNIGLSVGEDGPIIVDDQFEYIADSLNATVMRLAHKPIEFVVNTHWHYDHSDGNKVFGPDGVLIVAHENSRTRMEALQVLSVSEYNQEAYPETALPKITFDESIRLHWNEDIIEIFHAPAAHTDGDAIVWFKESNVFHMGDVFVTYGFPYIDHENGGDLDGIIAACESVAALADDETWLIPGHGRPSRRSDLLAFIEMLKTIRARIAVMIDDGMTLEEIIAAQPAHNVEGVGSSPDAAVRWTYLAVVD